MALAISSRRSTVAAIGSALAAIALAAAVAGRSCRVTPPGPEATVGDLIQAARAGDRAVVLELLAPTTRARLEAEAKRATDLVGASVRYTAKDLISIGNTEHVATPTDITVIAQSDATAVVEIVAASGRSRMELVKVAGRWKIELPQYARQ